MIRLQNVNKSFRLDGVVKTVARDLNFTFPTGKCMALIGRNGAGKSTMLQMIAGTVQTDTGDIVSDGTISFPVGFAGSFHNDLTGAQNAKFLARIYGLDTTQMNEFVQEFAGLGNHYHLPVRTYSSGMKSRLAFAASMAIPFDTYLIDEITAVGDQSFKEKSEAMLRERLRSASAIVVAHSMPLLKRLCDECVVLEKGNFYYYPEVDRGIEHHSYLMKGQLPPWQRKHRRKA